MIRAMRDFIYFFLKEVPFYLKIQNIFTWLKGVRISPPSLDQPLKKVVYTCITGYYDHLISHTYVSDQWDYICFTDNQELLDKGQGKWKVCPLQFASLDDARNSRWHKLFPDRILSEYDVSLYVDANIDIVAPDLFNYVNKKLLKRPEETLAIHKHLYRNCIYKEAQECMSLQLDSRYTIAQHVLKLKELNYPENNGLQENNIIYRRHHDSQVKQVMEEWWWWISNYSRRDQLSFNYVIWHQNFKIHRFKKQFARNLNYGTMLAHRFSNAPVRSNNPPVVCQIHAE